MYTRASRYADPVDPEILGVYTSRKAAVENAKITFGLLSGGCYENGVFTRSDKLEEAVDNTTTLEDEGTLLYQCDHRGSTNAISLAKKILDGDL